MKPGDVKPGDRVRMTYVIDGNRFVVNASVHAASGRALSLVPDREIAFPTHGGVVISGVIPLLRVDAQHPLAARWVDVLTGTTVDLCALDAKEGP